MNINSTGITPSELTDYLAFWTAKLQEKYGNDFVIKPEGYIDNLATASSVTNMQLEEVLMFMAKQLNPYTAEGEFQDALYALIGLVRRYATYTVVNRTVSGTVGLNCPKGSIRFKNRATEDIFELNTELTISENGTAIGSFTAIELGAIDLDSSALLDIIDSPDGINGVYYTDGNLTKIGDDYEDDSEFRERWIANQSVANSATSGGVEKYLLDLVTNPKNLNVLQNRTNVTVEGVPPHSFQIIIYSAESDLTIAQTIFNHLLDGIGLYGTTSVNISDSSGSVEPISFTRATAIPIYFRVEVALKEDYTLSMVTANIKNAIVDNFNVNMGQKVVANDFIEFIKDVEGVDYVSDIGVNTDNEDIWHSKELMDIDEIATTVFANVTVVEEE